LDKVKEKLTHTCNLTTDLPSLKAKCSPKRWVAKSIGTKNLVPAQLPIMGGNLNFKVFDKDSLINEIVGSFALKSKEIIDVLNGRYFWKNIYGSPLNCSGKHTDRMNENPLIGSLWKGRILMQVYAEKTNKPVLLVRNIDIAEINAAAVHLTPK
jgi:hypothetical protein